jgi:hypothetical protein
VVELANSVRNLVERMHAHRAPSGL